jgi:roadblock/LC7 domain-containing protein
LIGFILTIELDWPAFFNPIYRKNCTLTAGPYDERVWPVFSPDGKTLAYTAEIDGKWYVVNGKEKAGPYDDISYSLTFSPDGKTLAYRAEIDGELQSMLLFEGNEYIGSICNNSIIYFSNNQIFIE